MKISWRLTAFGLLGFLIFLIATAPAEVVLARLQSRGIFAAGVSGSIWNGRASALNIGALSLGTTSWRVHALALFTGKIRGDISVKRDDGSATAVVSKEFGPSLSIQQLRGSFPIATLGGLGIPGGWQGSVRLDLPKLELKNNWPISAAGTIEATNLVGPAHQPVAIGSFRVEFAPTSRVGSEGITGTLTSMGDGPLDVSGALRLLPNRTYVIDAQVATRPNAPESIVKALQYLGPADAQGRRPLSMSGSL